VCFDVCFDVYVDVCLDVCLDVRQVLYQHEVHVCGFVCACVSEFIGGCICAYIRISLRSSKARSCMCVCVCA